MNILDKIKSVFSNGFYAFKSYPVVIVSAIIFTLINYYRIATDQSLFYDQDVVLDAFQMSLTLAITFNLFFVAYANRNNKKHLWFTIATVGVAIVSYISLRYFGVSDAHNGFKELVIGRVIALNIVAVLLFMFYNKSSYDYAMSLFMTQKAFFIALLYGGVMMFGASATIGAFEALVYNDLSSDVYGYVGATVGLIAFTIFVGYFPSLKNLDDERHLAVRTQPKFIKVLIEFIFNIIFFALSLVLLIWAGKTIISSDWPAFGEVSAIVLSYIIFGIWLYLMNIPHNSKVSRWFKKLFPILGLIIIAFGIRVLFREWPEEGLTISIYGFVLTILGGIVALLGLLIKGEKLQELIVVVFAVCILISVAPLINAVELPFNVQMHALETYLIEHEILVNDDIVPNASLAIEKQVKISKWVNRLAYKRDLDYPTWFKRELSDDDVFVATFGFEKVWYIDDTPSYAYVYLRNHLKVVNIEGYQYHLNSDDFSDVAMLNGYELERIRDYDKKIFKLIISKENTPVCTFDLNAAVQPTIDAYAVDSNKTEHSLVLSYEYEEGGFKMKVVLNQISVYQNELDHLSIEEIYIKKQSN